MVRKTPSDGALSLVRAFELFGPAYMRWVEAQLPAHRGSSSRLRLLAALSEQGPLTMSGLRHCVGGSAQNITGLIDAMEAEGLVRRKANPKDRRSMLVELTERSSKDVLHDRKEHAARVAELFEKLSKAQRSALLDAINALTSVLLEVSPR
jgi:DNA-binding MarR family transcriptional regulator